MGSKFEKAYQELVERLEQGVMAKPKPRQSQAERIAQLRWEQYQKELPTIQRQQAIDAVWSATLAERRRQAIEDRRDCHKGRGDPDFNEERRDDPLGIWGRQR